MSRQECTRVESVGVSEARSDRSAAVSLQQLQPHATSMLGGICSARAGVPSAIAPRRRLTAASISASLRSCRRALL